MFDRADDVAGQPGGEYQCDRHGRKNGAPEHHRVSVCALVKGAEVHSDVSGAKLLAGEADRTCDFQPVLCESVCSRSEIAGAGQLDGGVAKIRCEVFSRAVVNARGHDMGFAAQRRQRLRGVVAVRKRHCGDAVVGHDVRGGLGLRDHRVAERVVIVPPQHTANREEGGAGGNDRHGEQFRFQRTRHQHTGLSAIHF